MRSLLTVTFFAAVALATPALALTVTAAPNRDQAAHLKQERGPGGGVDLRDSLAGGGGRPLSGYSQGPTDGQTVTYGFGSVTTTVRTGRQDLGPTVYGAPTRYGHPTFIQPEFVQRRR